MAQVQKHQTEVLNIAVDFAARLPGGTSISSCAASVVTGDVTLGTATFSGTTVTVTVSAGTPGITSTVQFRANLSDSEVLIATVDVPVVSRIF